MQVKYEKKDIIEVVIKMKEIINKEQMERTIRRMTHEIIERNHDLNNIVLVGVLKKGYPLATILKENIKEFSGIDVPLYKLDISNYRDDVKLNNPIEQYINVHLKNVIIIDDVLFTGRSVRAAMDALTDFGRAKNYQLAVLVDRGHKELPIKADYVGKNIPTSLQERVIVDFELKTVNID